MTPKQIFGDKVPLEFVDLQEIKTIDTATQVWFYFHRQKEIKLTKNRLD